MSYILVGTEDSTLTAYPFEKIGRVDYHHNKSVETEDNETEAEDDETEDDGDHAVSVRLYIGGNECVLYDEKGNASIVEPGQTIYRKVLSGLESGKPVNLTDFASTEPKKAPAKKTTTKKTEPNPEPETPAEQPSEDA